MSRLAEAKELVRQELLEALQNKSGDSVRDLFEIYDKLRTMEPMETGMVTVSYTHLTLPTICSV